MKLLCLVSIFLAVIAIVKTNPVTKFSSQLEDEWQRDCAAETNDKLKNIQRNFEMLQNPTVQCYFKCMLSKYGIFTSNGFNHTAEIIPLERSEEFKNKITECVGPRRKNESDCSWGYRGYACLFPDLLIMVVLL